MQHGYNLISCQKGRIAEPHSRHHRQHCLKTFILWMLEEDLEEGAQPGPVTAPPGKCIPACDQSCQWPPLYFEALVWKGSSPLTEVEAVFSNVSLSVGIFLVFGDSEIYYFASRGILVNFQILITVSGLLVFMFYKWKIRSIVFGISSQLEIITLFFWCFSSSKQRLDSSGDSSCGFCFSLEGHLNSSRAKAQGWFLQSSRAWEYTRNPDPGHLCDRSRPQQHLLPQPWRHMLWFTTIYNCWTFTTSPREGEARVELHIAKSTVKITWSCQLICEWLLQAIYWVLLTPFLYLPFHNYFNFFVLE